MEKEAPLASRLRPRTLDEVVGQQHIIGKDKLLYRAIKADKLGSLIFYGPPGTGKTTLAKVIANTTSAQFRQMNATVAGKKDMEEVVQAAKDAMGMYGQRTILFIDEIHRFNKGQQDYLLPFVEDGTLILIGATTENPYFEVNKALLSRSRIFELKPLEQADIKELIRRAVYDRERGMGAYDAVIDERAADFLADAADGDARRPSTRWSWESSPQSGERTEKFTWIWLQPRNASKNGRFGTIRTATATTTRFPPLSKACGDRIRMPRCIIWPGCSMRGRT